MNMIRLAVLTAVLALGAGPVLAQVPAPPAPDAAPPPAPLAPPAKGLVRVKVTTPKGVIILDLNAAAAPVTAGNFLKYVDAKRFDGIAFYRAARAQGDPTYGVIQGGLRNDPKKIYAPIAHESTAKTGLKHLDGTISMGRSTPGSATADFFICAGEAEYLDAHPGGKGDNLGFAAFGQVVQGMEVVRAILASPTSASGGPPGMRREMLKPPIPIISVRRVR